MNTQEFKKGQEVWAKVVVVAPSVDVNGEIQLSDGEDGLVWVKPEEIMTAIPEKPVVPQVAIDFYEKYKDEFLPVFKWFEGLYDDKFLYEFQDRDKLISWLNDTDNTTSLQRELALVTLIVNGVEAVQVEKEKLYTVEIPNPTLDNLEFIIVLKRLRGRVCLVNTYNYPGRELSYEYRFTEAEIKEDFDWAWEAGFAKPVEE